MVVLVFDARWRKGIQCSHQVSKTAWLDGASSREMLMNLFTAPCCHRDVDVPVNAAALEESLLICPHCGAALTFRENSLRIAETQIDGSLARLLSFLQDMQSSPEKYLPDVRVEEEAAGPRLRGTPAAPGVH
jgi:hypothetical protein